MTVKSRGLLAFATGIALAFAGAANASSTTSYQVLVESRLDDTAPFDVFLASFDTLNDVYSGNLGGLTGYTQLDVAPNYKIDGFTQDPGGYRLILQTRTDDTAPFEVFTAGFATLNDVFNANLGANTGYTQIDVAPNYELAGLTWDGSAYRVLVETRVDDTAPFEVFLASFSTLGDLFNANLGSPTGYTQIDVAPNYQITDFTWDGSAYRVMLQTRADDTAPFEVFVATFNTLNDLFNANLGSPTGYTQIDVAPNYQIVGFASTTTVTPPPPPPPGVPEPATWALMSVGVGLLGAGLRRRRAATTLRVAA